MERTTKLVQKSGQPPHCVPLRAHFTQTGKSSDGEHLCLVMDVLVGDIHALQDENRRFPPPLAKLLLRDTLRGLVQLHTSGGVHTGDHPTNALQHCTTLKLDADLKHANIMCNLPEATSEGRINDLLAADPSRRYPPEPSWNGPVETAVSQPVPTPTLDQALSASFMISDFGSGEYTLTIFTILTH